MPKKSAICEFVFISILKLAFLKNSIMSFRIRSVFCLDAFLKKTSRPVACLSSLFDSKDSIWIPTSSQISAPSKMPMVMSKQLFLEERCSFFQGSLSLYNKDFLQCFIIHKSFSGTSMYCWANRIELSNISLDIDG